MDTKKAIRVPSADFEARFYIAQMKGEIGPFNGPDPFEEHRRPPMSDQAQGLRDFVSTVGNAGAGTDGKQGALNITQPLRDFVAQQNADCSVSKEEWEELTRPDPAELEYRRKLGRIAETETVLRKAMEPDWKGLWMALKEEARFDATHYDLDMVEHGEDRGKIYKTDDSIRAQSLLDRMEQAETLARFKGGV